MKGTNPFTKFLRQWSTNDKFSPFVDHWDSLERMVVAVYRGQMTPEAAGAEFEQIWPWLRDHYPDWRDALEPYWRATRVAGEQPTTHPFLLLLNLESPAAIPGNWLVMQHLPAAREAINRYLIDQSQDANNGSLSSRE